MNLDNDKFVYFISALAILVIVIMAFVGIWIDEFYYNKDIKPYEIINSEKVEYYIGVNVGNDIIYCDFITIDISKRDSFIHVWDKQLDNMIDIHKKIK